MEPRGVEHLASWLSTAPFMKLPRALYLGLVGFCVLKELDWGGGRGSCA
jgi:hypothetical protein